MKLRKLIFNVVYDPLYSIYFSFKDIMVDAVDLFSELRKPRMWSSILYVLCFYAIFTRRFTLFKWLIPFVFIVYIIRQRVDGRYRAMMRVNALKNNNDMVLEEEYKKYLRECHFTKQEPLDYTAWKLSELEKVQNDKSEMSSQSQ